MKEPVSNHRIKQAIENLPRDNPERRESILDCLYANKVGGVKSLEQLFDYWLWSEGQPQEEAHKAYVIALGEIEEELVNQGLIYTELNEANRLSAD
jgi:hypothetical protein